MNKVTLCENVLDPETWEVIETEDLCAFIQERFAQWPSTAHIYRNYVAQSADVTPHSEADIERLKKLQGDFWIVVYPEGIELIVAIVAIAVAAVAVGLAFLLRPSPNVKNDNTSTNNSLSDRQNRERPGQRIPDIFGKKWSTPDLIGVPYRLFLDNTEVEYAYMCIGRGYYKIHEIRDDTTPLQNIDGATAEVWPPYLSPNSSFVIFGDSPENHMLYRVGPAIQDRHVYDVKRSNAINGQVLRAPNATSFKSHKNVRFVYPDAIETNADANLQDYYSPGDTIVVNGSGSLGLDGTYTAADVQPNEIVLVDPAAVNANWNNLALLPGAHSDYISPVIVDASDQWVGPFVVPEPATQELWCNFVAPQGLYELDSDGNQHAFSAVVEIEVTAVDKFNYSPIGAPTYYSVNLKGSGVLRSQVGSSLKAVLPSFGPCQVRARRISNTDLRKHYTVVDQIQWRDCYSVDRMEKRSNFGNVTTVQTVTFPTQDALALKQRKLNVLVTRLVPQLSDPTTVTVDSTEMPWTFGGGINAAFDFGLHDGTPPQVYGGLVAGDLIQVSVVDGEVQPNGIGQPYIIANGWAAGAQAGPYELGQDQATNWGTDANPTDGFLDAANAVDSNPDTWAAIGYVGTHKYAGLIIGFHSSLTSVDGMQLKLLTEILNQVLTYRSAGAWYTLDNWTTHPKVFEANRQNKQWTVVDLPDGTNPNDVKVMFFVDAHDDMGMRVYMPQLVAGPDASVLYPDSYDNKIQQGQVMGAFTDGSGNVIQPVSIGDSTSVFIVPEGATQLQLGINDTSFINNSGSITVLIHKITSSSTFLSDPLPATEDFGTIVNFDHVRPSRNVADIFCAIARDAYIGNRQDSEIDIVGIYSAVAKAQAYFGTWLCTEFCYSFDDDTISFEETAADVATAGFCIAYRRGNVLSLFFEGKTHNSSLLFNHRNKLPRSETRSVMFGRNNDYDGIELEYIDPNAPNNPDMDSPMTLYFPNADVLWNGDTQVPTALNPKKVTTVGIRNYVQAQLLGWRLYNKLIRQNVTVQFDATQEAAVLIPSERILVADNTRPETQDGEVIAQVGLQLTLSQKVSLPGGHTYTIFLQHYDGTVEAITITAGTDDNQVVLASPPVTPLVLDETKFAKTTYIIVSDEDTIDAGGVKSYPLSYDIVDMANPNVFAGGIGFTVYITLLDPARTAAAPSYTLMAERIWDTDPTQPKEWNDPDYIRVGTIHILDNVDDNHLAVGTAYEGSDYSVAATIQQLAHVGFGLPGNIQVTDPVVVTFKPRTISKNQSAFLLIEKTPKDGMIYEIKAVNYDDRYYEHDQDYNDGDLGLPDSSPIPGGYGPNGAGTVTSPPTVPPLDLNTTDPNEDIYTITFNGL